MWAVCWLPFREFLSYSKCSVSHLCHHCLLTSVSDLNIWKCFWSIKCCWPTITTQHSFSLQKHQLWVEYIISWHKCPSVTFLTFHAAAMVTAIDDGIGDIVSALKARNMWENTLFIFSSGMIFKQFPIWNEKRNQPLYGFSTVNGSFLKPIWPAHASPEQSILQRTEQSWPTFFI